MPLVGGLSLPRHARLLALPGVGEVAVGLALPSVMRRMLRKGMAEGAEPDRAWFDDVAARFDQGTQRAVLRLFRAATPAAREQAGRELRGLDVPALVVHGERDPWHPPRTGQAYAAVLPQSELLDSGGRALAVARGPGRGRARARVPAPLNAGHRGITSVGCSCDSARAAGRILPHGPVDLSADRAVRRGVLRLPAHPGIADNPGVATTAFNHARDVINIERTLNVFIEPSVQTFVPASLGLLTSRRG